ncbi:MAG TPA: tRNA 2-thiouridine(34) synthase MnmA, partial [candidate division Zixibacteria bacterium]|nr:tRNA 2-thiouridine(34) synthase MnmA [candidate division Zixibacteria bacterium]
PIFNTEGNQIGEHKGYAYYTIGQRKGFGIAASEPLYVIRISPANRSITVGTKEHLFTKRFTVIDMNHLSPEFPEIVTTKIRYKHDGSPARASLVGNTATVEFCEPERAITPGQSAVFYNNDRVLGGGIIDKLLD